MSPERFAYFPPHFLFHCFVFFLFLLKHQPLLSVQPKEKAEDEMEIDLAEDEEKEVAVSDGKKKQFLLPLHVKEHLKLLWNEERDALDLLFGTIQPIPGSEFFFFFFFFV